MYLDNGIGLAAPQIGHSLQVFVVDTHYKKEEDEKVFNCNPHIFINPKIVHNSEDLFTFDEGCLSLPNIYESITRKKEITVTFQDLNGKTNQLVAQDILSTCIQHENDHLNGTVFIDHLGVLKKQLLVKKLLKQKKHEYA